MIHKKVTGVTALVASLLACSTAAGGPYTDDLSKCLVAATSEQDKSQLVEWIFFSLSLNPRISPYAQISAEQRTAADKGLAKLFERLVAESCAEETKAAIRYEGSNALTESFSLLGQVAAMEIFKDPAVAEGTSKFAEYLDDEKLNEALGLSREEE